ncbi:hypothetical protein [Cellulomonas sp. S1-8]|uniref:hypothetical protein n=1 Tax=Cellulomonas sp. S1-8 TaxID=2904790 RepID=UPI0022437E3F|nr:hypothetical protein [Cellulomonas sp. S1-8]UZN02626.1 hypothetical protein OKX07_16445 [Cellulomonas sp. S1-8]
MSSSVAQRQLKLIHWDMTESGSGPEAAAVARDLEMLLFATEESDDGSYERLENVVESQGHLFDCSPAAVSVIIAAVTEGSIQPAALASSLDLLGRMVGPSSAPLSPEPRQNNLREACRLEAIKGYWALVVVARERDRYNAWRAAESVLAILDKEHSRAILEGE